MKLKNTLGVVIGSLVAATSIGALAQGQGAVEVEAFGKHYFTDSSRNIEDGELYGAGVGYFLTDDVSLNLSHGVYSDEHSEDPEAIANGKHKAISGNLTALDAVYHFGTPGEGLRPYVSGGFAHQSIGQAAVGGRDKSTFAEVGGGLKYYFTDNFFAKGGVDGTYNIDKADWEWMAGVGVGLNFGGGAAPAPAPAPVAAAATTHSIPRSSSP